MMARLEYLVWEIEEAWHPPTFWDVCATARDDVKLVLPRTRLECAICAECRAEMLPCQVDEYEKRLREVACRTRCGGEERDRPEARGHRRIRGAPDTDTPGCLGEVR